MHCVYNLLRISGGIFDGNAAQYNRDKIENQSMIHYYTQQFS